MYNSYIINDTMGMKLQMIKRGTIMIKFKLSKVIASVLIAASVFALNPIGANATWKKDSTGWWYTEGNSWATGWRVIGGKSYFFMYNGYMKTGWIKPDSKSWLYLDPSQGNLVTGWKKIDGYWYYFNKEAVGTKEKGAMRTGWVNDNGRWYYFSDTPVFNDEGQMKTGFVSDGKGKYYLDESNTSNRGVMKTGWQKVNNYWFYFNTSADSGVTGNMKKGWHKIGANWYYFSIFNGIMASDTWINEYYVDSNGAWIPDADNSQILTFTDENLEQIIRNKVDKPTGVLYKSDVENITELTIWDSSISNIDLSGIENLVNLESLKILNIRTSDINILKGLTKLKYLSLANCGINDISPLKELTNLESLSLDFNGSIKDISPLETLTNLKYLHLMYNQISDISPLSGLTNLEMLELNGNPIEAEDVQSLKEVLPNCDIRN